MADREKVIKGLECHQIDKDHRINCSDCPYHCDEFMNGLNELHNDALALLKEQEEQINTQRNNLMILLNEREAVEPLAKEDDTYECICGAIVGWDELDASGIVPARLNYCPFCGKHISWEGR